MGSATRKGLMCHETHCIRSKRFVEKAGRTSSEKRAAEAGSGQFCREFPTEEHHQRASCVMRQSVSGKKNLRKS